MQKYKKYQLLRFVLGKFLIVFVSLHFQKQYNVYVTIISNEYAL